jgi:hypothetical protein
MRRFTPESAAAVVELEQMILDWCREIDFNGGRKATEYFTEDCVAESGAISFRGHAGVKKYYGDRLDFIRANQKDGVRTTRHTVLNLHTSVADKDHATVNCYIITFGGEGKPPVMSGTAPITISDTQLDCVRGADGNWRIAKFTASPSFVGSEGFAQNAILGQKRA